MGALLVLLAALALLAAGRPADAAPKVVILSTTTSTQDSGLLDVVVPMFERQTGYTVKTVAVGTGQALALAARGEADVTLAHAPELEKKHVAEGKLFNRRLVMDNDFVIVGPPTDPAKIAGERSAVEALRRIAAAGARFVSRGDNSGTHLLELRLWKAAGLAPDGAWYIESGQAWGPRSGWPPVPAAIRSPTRPTIWPTATRRRSGSWAKAAGPWLTASPGRRATPTTGP